MRQRLITGLLAGSAVSLLAMGAALAEPDPVSLTVVSWGGAWSEAQQRAWHDPYMEENPHVRIINDDGAYNALAGLRAQHDAGNVTWDLISFYPSDAQLACEEGLVIPFDHDEELLPGDDGSLPSEDFVEGSMGECLVPQMAFSTVMAFNTEMFDEDKKPETIADFFDTENFPGRRAIHNRAVGNLEWALYADGVAPEDIYDLLETEEGQARAFAKLDTIKDSLVFWEEGAQAPQLLADQEVSFASGYNGRLFEAAQAEGQPFEIIWDGQILEFEGWSIPSGSDNIEAAMEFVRWATDTQRLADQTKYISYGPARYSSQALVGQHEDLGIEMGPHLPTHEDNFFSPIELNNDFWTDWRDELTERFTAWMTQ